MATSPNYAWAEPDNSSLVKNGASDIRTLGDAIDTSVWNVGYGQAGKNKIINGAFAVNQRNFTSNTTDVAFIYDRFNCRIAGDGTATYTAQTFTPGTAPVAGYEAANYLRIVTSGQTTTAVRTTVRQTVEDVRTFAGQTATLSFWAKAASGTPKIAGFMFQNFGSGGSASVDIPINAVTISTSWARYSLTIAIPSISGKTIGTSSQLGVDLAVSAGSTFNTQYSSIGIQNNTFEIWGVQVEYGSKATPFQTATGTIQGELAACQRYYYRAGSSDSVAYAPLSNAAFSQSTTITTGAIALPVQMRVPPTSIDSSNVGFRQASGSVVGMTSVTLDTTQGSTTVATIYGTTSVIVANLPGFLVKNNNSAGYLGFSAEL